MKEVIIVGAGGHAAELNEYLELDNNLTNASWKVVGLIDDNPESYKQYSYKARFLGSIKDHQVHSKCLYMMGIANLKFRKLITENLINKGATFLTFVHPTAYVSPSATIGKGSVLAPYVNLGPNTIVGDNTLINARCSLGHDTQIGNFNFISPNVCFSGNTKVGDENIFGINSATIPGIQVGNRNKVMAGMVIDKNIGDDSTVFFRYKQKIIAIPKLK
ncbi:MAG: acetyltransferase [Balneolales bacterium]|nr:acetyltransferase [Balneolales bacterium]